MLRQELNLCQKGNDMMSKNEIYVGMLAVALPYIRNIQSLDGKDKGNDVSCYFEAELIHNLTHTLLIAQFTEHDIWFLNHQSKYYYDNCNEDISPNYNKHIEYIRELFKLVPEELKNKLEWTGP